MLRSGATYTKQELVDMFHTDKMCNIKRSVESMGYKWDSNNKRGNNFRVTITAITIDKFKEICTNKLGIPAQSDFRILKHFFYQYFCDEEFQQLPITEMERILNEDDKTITRQTIAKWIKLFEEKNLIYKSNMDYTYYVTLTLDDRTSTEEITREEYTRAWKRYWEVKKQFGYKVAFVEMCKVNGGKVSKKPKILENGFYSELIDALVEAIESED